MDTSLNPCLCKDLYGYLTELYLSLGFSYLLVRNFPASNNGVHWFSSVLGGSFKLLYGCLVWLWSSMEEKFV